MCYFPWSRAICYFLQTYNCTAHFQFLKSCTLELFGLTGPNTLPSIAGPRSRKSFRAPLSRLSFETNEGLKIALKSHTIKLEESSYDIAQYELLKSEFQILVLSF